MTAFQSIALSPLSCLTWTVARFRTLNKLIANPGQIKNWRVSFVVQFIMFTCFIPLTSRQIDIFNSLLSLSLWLALASKLPIGILLE